MKELDDAALEEMARYFGALATPVRLKILNSLREGERSVGELAALTACTQPNISKHLAVLAHNGVVGRTHRGTSVYYRIADPRIYKLCDLVCGHIGRRCADLAQRGRVFMAAAGTAPKARRAR